MFLVLQVLCWIILVNYNDTYEAVFATTANEITGSLDKKYNNVEYYFNLKKTNEQLAEENARLKNMLRSDYAETDSNKTIHIDSLLRDSLKRLQKFVFLPAKVVNNSVSQENNYITLEKGALQGVKKDMAVTGPDGIVGRVVLVSDNFSKVMSLLNHNSRVSAMLKKGFYTGIIEWDGVDPDYVTLRNITKSAAVQKGDTILTSNISGNFPPGLMVGTVSEINSEPASNFYLLKIKTATNFYSLQYAYIIENMLWEEQRKLESQTIKNQ